MLLLTALCFSIFNPREREIEKVTVVSDTVTMIKTDTLVFTKVIEREVKTIDTVYVKIREEVLVPIPICRYNFYEEGKYDITVAGYDVTLEEIKVFPKTITTTVNTITERVIPQMTWDLYLGVNLSHYRGELIPSIGLSLKAPKKWLFSAHTGYYDNSWFVGGSIQYEITK